MASDTKKRRLSANNELSLDIENTIHEKPNQVISELTQCEKRIKHFNEFYLNGQHENQVYEGDEADLQKHMDSCEKNPGHADFIPYKFFKMDDIIPESHRDQDMFDFIKVVADLTVRINVNGVSPKRPDFWHGKKKFPYPLGQYDDHKPDDAHTGSGQVNEVIQFKDGVGSTRHGKTVTRDYKTIKCSTCTNSNEHKVWWEIVIRTAPHVVFDQIEASKTSCRLFFDSKDKPKEEDDILRQMNLLEVNVEEDWCLLSYAFCNDDMKHRDTLLNLVKQRVDLWKKVCQKHQGKGDMWTFIVSHPHGMHKHVSFGECVKNLTLSKFKDESGKFDLNEMDRTKLKYNTATCKGSSGAPVRCMGLGVGHVHSEKIISMESETKDRQLSTNIEMSLTIDGKAQDKIQVASDLLRNEKRIQHLYEFHLNGKHENQVYEGDEADLHKHFKGCKKNPGHDNFVPYKSFKMDDIPKSHRDPDMFDFIKVVADLTVRINVNCVSPERPEFWPDTKIPYPFYGHHKQVCKRTGSGQVNEVIQFVDGIGSTRHGKTQRRDYKTCICNTCKNSGKPNNVWCEIVIRTAPHVVFDEIEASETSCRLFFDGEDKPRVGKDSSDDFLRQMNLLEVDVVEDWCLLTYVFCDDDMKHRDTLLNLVKQRVDLWKKVCQKHQGKEDMLTFIVSHPHGYPKYVTFGNYIENTVLGEFNDVLGKFDENEMLRTKLTYSTPTCEGSSGAPVRCTALGVGHVHSGTQDGVNYSGVSLVYRQGSPYLKN